MGLFDLFSKLSWTLCVMRNGREVVYAMHGNSVMRIVGYCLSRFKDGSEPVVPWSLYLLSNHTNKGFNLCSKHVTSDGEDLTQSFYDALRVIDPDWDKRKGEQRAAAEPIFMDNKTRKRLPVMGKPIDYNDPNFWTTMENKANQPEEITFHSVLRNVFGLS